MSMTGQVENKPEAGAEKKTQAPLESRLEIRPEIRDEVVASIKNFAVRARGEARPATAANELSEFIHRKAALISAHFLLPAGSRVMDMGCGTGEVTYMLAQMNPRWGIIGVDTNPDAIEFAQKNYKLPNLAFRVSDVSALDAEDESVDGIINSNLLHRIYSESGYDTDEVVSLLDRQIRKLKIGGTMLIRDYILPSEKDFVLLELPEGETTGKTPMEMSDPDLLILFSQSSRPIQGDCEGFFIEELPRKRDNTRLFRLQHKWALEFIHRKHLRHKWEQELRREYTFFTHQDFRREFARMGMRMVFSSPYSNPWVVKNHFKGRFQLYNESGQPMGMPATNDFIVAQKVSDKQSLMLEERRPSQKPVGDIKIVTVRDNNTNKIHELVKRPGEYCDIVPYRITPDNRLMIYVRSGYPRPIVNAVMRGAHNLDGKRWSGHLIEPVVMDTSRMTEKVDDNRKQIFGYVDSYLGLRPKSDNSWYLGETYFPSPDRIDEAIEPVFIEVENPQKTSWAVDADKASGFTETGTITELDGADILLASQVGLLPEPRLEMHVFDLMTRYDIPMPRWIGEQMPIMPGDPVEVKEPEDMLKGIKRTKFEDADSAATSLRPVKAVFVEEGKVGRSTRGLSVQDVEFVVSEDGIENIAIVVPLTRGWDNNILIALEPKIMPVPNRLGGDGAMLNVPSFPLPREVKTIEDAKAYIADKFKIPPEQVGQVGESYFTHTGVTPQRIYPFMISAVPKAGRGPDWHYGMLKSLKRMMIRGFRPLAQDGIKVLARVQMAIGANHDASLKMNQDLARDKGFSLSTSKTLIDDKESGYTSVPSRILGQRGGPVTLANAPVETKVEVKAAAPVETKSAPQSKATPAKVTPPVIERVGKRLVESYTQAKQMMVKTSDTPVQVRTAPPVVQPQINKIKPPVLEPKPPEMKHKKNT